MRKSKSDITSKTGKKLAKKRGNPNAAEAGKATQFKKGFDSRRNLNGPPRKFNELREMVLNLFSEDVEVEKDKKKTQLEKMLRDWLTSGDYNKQRTAVEYGFGKVPDEIKYSFDVGEFIRNNISIFTDGQLERIRMGEDPTIVLVEVIKDTQDIITKNKTVK